MDKFSGVWLRTELYEPKGQVCTREEGRTVLWLQHESGVFVDIRVDDPVQPLLSKSFAGYLSFDLSKNRLTWTRVIDFRPRGPPDVGEVRFLDEDVLEEQGVLPGDDFTEIWQRIDRAIDKTSSADCCFTIQHRTQTDRTGFFIVVGGHFAFTLSRSNQRIVVHTIESLAGIFDSNNCANPIDTALDYVLEHTTIVGNVIDWKVKYSLDSKYKDAIISEERCILKELFLSVQWTLVQGIAPAFLWDRSYIERLDSRTSSFSMLT
jgi:hypothetical protein